MKASTRLLLLFKSGATPYTDQVLATSPFAYWPLSETSGTQAADVAGGFHGTYNNVTLNAATFPDGTPAPLFDASNERVALPAVSLDTPFDPLSGSMACWLRVRVAGVWSDGVLRAGLSVGADANNRIFVNKSDSFFSPNIVQLNYRAGGTVETKNISAYQPTTWFHLALTWDKTGDTVRFYLNGTENTPASTTLGTWAGTLATTFTAIGNISSAGGANFWDGYIKHCALWNRVLTPAEIATLVPADFLV